MTRDAKKFLTIIAVVLIGAVFISLIVGLVGGGSAVAETRDYEVDGEISSLEVEIGAADFRIEIGNGFSVRSNLKNLTFRQTGNRLVLKEKSFGNKKYDDAFLTICIPEGIVFNEIDITTGAGRFTAETLSAEVIDFEFGAGEVNIGELNASLEADIEGGAGQIIIGGGRLCDLQLDMGVGELFLVSEIVRSGELNLGVGEVNITLLGGRENYTAELNKGIGSIRFDGDEISKGGDFGNGKNLVEINGGIGSISISFE